MTGIQVEFESVVRRWSGEAAWYFAVLPLDLAVEICSQVACLLGQARVDLVMVTLPTTRVPS